MATLPVLAAALAMIAATAARAAPAAGDWCGQIAPKPTAVLPLALHLSPGADGGWTGALDSLAQDARGMPLAEVAVGDTALAFEVPSVAGRFEGHWDPAAGRWNGQWTQGASSLPLTFTPAAKAAGPHAAGLDGDWDGALDAGAGMKLRLAVHLRSGVCGTAGGLDSIDQGARGLPLADITRAGSRVAFAAPVVGGTFEGVLDPAGATIDGTWKQGGNAIPLVLTRRKAGQPEARLDRPQTPEPPYPYRTEEVAFDDQAARIRIAGMLSLPQGPGPFPAVALIAGSGPHTRDEDVFGHKIFLVLADYLTRHGVAVLRYDKRGLGGSTGDYAAATVQDFAADAQAAVGFLKTHKDIDPRRIGLVGHSEGGLIAPMVAVRDPDVAFIVLMAGPGVGGVEILEAQQRLIAQAMGVPSAKVARASVDEARLIEIVLSEPDHAAAETRLKAAADEIARDEGEPAKAVEDETSQINSAWFRSFLAYDPAQTLRRLRIPVLALIGSKDLQVPATLNLPALRAALADDPRAQVEEIPGLNHLFQPATTGAPSEYQTIATTVAPEALALIAGWIRRTAGLSG
jgi:pimeloyl-ACP methyl ester carboxylesterase